MAGKQDWRKWYNPAPIDLQTPYMAVGGTVFGPHDGIARRSFVLAFAPGYESEVKEANQRLAKTLADRLNSEPDIRQPNPPLALVEQIIRSRVCEVMAECGGQFQFNKLIFTNIQGNGVIF